VRQVPRFAEVGLPGEERELELRLKLLADAALVGLPNAGKSSLLTRLSNARPKIAPYPFTTLAPVLGTVEAPDGRQLVVADVPGLVEGASAGVGLGHAFLAHLERARSLAHVIDAAKPAEEQWRAVDTELADYGAGLDRLPQIVVLNKIDLNPSSAFAVADPRIVGVFRVSAATGEGVAALHAALFELVPPPTAEPEADEVMADFLVYRPQPRARAWSLVRTDRGFRVLGTPPDEAELDRALREAGARRGAAVELGEESFEFVP
jgi:GTP-binding protein